MLVSCFHISLRIRGRWGVVHQCVLCYAYQLAYQWRIVEVLGGAYPSSPFRSSPTHHRVRHHQMSETGQGMLHRTRVQFTCGANQVMYSPHDLTKCAADVARRGSGARVRNRDATAAERE